VPDNADIQLADPVLRHRRLARFTPLALIGLSLAGLLVWWGNRADILVADAVQSAVLVLAWAIALALLLPTRAMWCQGRDARQQRRFPPIRTAVIRDTPVFHGDAAALRGHLQQALAVALGAFLLLTPLALSVLVLGSAFAPG
jgi:hypothetical protein